MMNIDEKLKNYLKRSINMEYEKERDSGILIILLLIAVIIVLQFGATIEAFKSFAPAFFIIMLIAIWLVSMNIGKMIKKWRK